jgi:acyl carrier protein
MMARASPSSERYARRRNVMAITESEIRKNFREFIVNNFLLGKGQADLKDGASFLDTGIVDSTGVLEIVGYLQDTWGVNVPDEDLLPENLDSVDNVTAYVLKKLA